MKSIIHLGYRLKKVKIRKEFV